MGPFTKGHSSTDGGLRGHSIGPLYPWGVVGRGYEGWSVTNHRTGYCSEVIHKEYAAAEAEAWALANEVRGK